MFNTTKWSHAICAAALVALCAGAATAATLFEDHFDGPLSPEWVSVLPNQWVSDGWLHCRKPVWDPPLDAVAVTHDGDQSWTDYEFSFIADPVTSVQMALAYIRTNGSRPRTGASGLLTLGYRLDFHGDDQSGYPNALVLYRDAGVLGEDLVLAAAVPGCIPAAPWHVDIQAQGPRIRVAVNGIWLLDWTDPNPILSGGVGLGSIWTEEARFDDVLVQTIPEPGAATLLALGALTFLRRRG
jgi:hypothetical protein